MNIYIPMDVIWFIVIILILTLVFVIFILIFSWVEDVNFCIYDVEELKEKNKKLEQQYKLLKKGGNKQ